MAFLIPENLRTRTDVSSGIQRLARVLQDSLDDAATVWYEPLFDVGGERPDVVALIPDTGILVFEVLEEKSGSVEVGPAERQLTITKRGVARTIDDPLVRADRFGAALRHAIDGAPILSRNERLPVAAVGVLPFLSRSQAVKTLGTRLDLNRCLFRDELEDALAQPDAFRRLLVRLLPNELRDPLTEPAEKVHRALIHPDTVIGSMQLPFPTMTPADELKVLDRRQESLAKTLGEGHRVIRGVAGSGKTLILTYRARLLAEAFPQQKILITCFNRSLAGVLDRHLPYPNITVRRIDQLIWRAQQRTGAAPISFNRPLDERAEAGLAALDINPSAAGRFDHVLIDEAQDFPTAALRFCTRLLREGSESLLVVGDGAQNIFRNKFSWKAAGINASGRTQILDRSYRSTREVLEYAYDFLRGDADDTQEADSASEDMAVIPPKKGLRSGPLPQFHYAASPTDEVLHIADRCRDLLADGVAPASIGVLYGTRNTGGFAWTDALCKALNDRHVPFFWATDPAHPDNKDEVGANPTKVVLSTIHSSKGLEFAHVFLCGYLDDRPPKERLLSRRLIYVGMTRATHQLVMTASGKHDYIADLEV